jgi:membrane-associated protein
MGQLVEGVLALPGWAALALLFTLPALEAPAFLGLVLPGELALLLGGVLAQQDRIPLAAALAVGVAGALVGDSAGYWIGRRWGPRLLTSGLGRRVGPARLHEVEALLLRGGGWALVVGRCTAGARVVLPGLAGMLGLRYRTFALWTGAAATLWAGGPRPARLPGRRRLAPCPPAHRPGGRRARPGGGGRPGCRLAPPPTGQAKPRRATPARRLGAAPRLGRRQVQLSTAPQLAGSGGDGGPWRATIEGHRELDGARTAVAATPGLLRLAAS